MKLPRKNEIYALEKDTQENYGIPALILMENAGEAVFDYMARNIPGYKKKKYLFFCGLGNNGGDGLVAARKIILDTGKPQNVRVFLMKEGTPEKSEAAVNFSIAAKTGVRMETVPSGKALGKAVRECDVIVDAIYGIGYRPSADAGAKIFSRVVQAVNSSGKTVIAVDIPSGVLADGGVGRSAIRADATIVFGFPKPGLVDYPGREYVGQRVDVPIGLPEEILEAPGVKTNLLTFGDTRQFYRPRKKQSHKGTYGHLLIVGGSAGNSRTGEPSLSGAVILAGLAALRSGAGLVTVAAPEKILAAVRKNLPEAMTLPLDGDAGTAVLALKTFVKKRKITSVLAGNGFGTGPRQKEILKSLVGIPSVTRLTLDADGLNILASDAALLPLLKAPGRDVILTPHIGEMARLTRSDRGLLKTGKMTAAAAFAVQNGVHLILKDAISAVAFPDGEVWLNEAGSPALAKGGSGDVLAGIVAGLFTSGYDARSACLLGAWCLGRAGELCESKRSAESAIARDVIETLPGVFRELNTRG